MVDFDPCILSQEHFDAVCRDSGFLARRLFPDIFKRDLSRLHRCMTDVMDAVDANGYPLHRQIVVAGPRGMGKSMLTTMGRAVRGIVMRQAKYVVYATAAADNAIEKTDMIRRSLRSNEIIHANFGRPMDKDEHGMKIKDSSKAYVVKFPEGDDPFYHGSKIVPRGMDQQFRSVGDERGRINLLIGDDVDNPRQFKSERSRREIADWWFDDACPAIADDPYTQVIYLGTMSVEGCVLEQLREMPGWTPVWLSMCDRNYQTLWPDWYPQKFVDQKVAQYQKRGRMDSFHREYMNDFNYTADNPFKPEMFCEYTDQSNGRKILIIDPAKKMTGRCEYAIVTISIEPDKGAVCIEDAVADHWSIPDFHANIRMAIEQSGARTLYVEDDGLGDHVTGPIKTYLSTNRINCTVDVLRSKTGKDEHSGLTGSKHARILSVVSMYSDGRIFHKAGRCQKLESQLLSFRPGCSEALLIDLADCVGYIPQVIEKEKITLAPTRRSGSKKQTIDEFLQERIRSSKIDSILQRRQHEMTRCN